MTGVADGFVRVRLAAPAHEGKANAELIRLLAARLGVPRRDVSLATGAAGRRKLVRVRGVDPAVAQKKLGF